MTVWQALGISSSGTRVQRWCEMDFVQPQYLYDIFLAAAEKWVAGPAAASAGSKLLLSGRLVRGQALSVGRRGFRSRVSVQLQVARPSLVIFVLTVLGQLFVFIGLGFCSFQSAAKGKVFWAAIPRVVQFSAWKLAGVSLQLQKYISAAELRGSALGESKRFFPETSSTLSRTQTHIHGLIWVWLKIKHGGLRRLWSIFPLTRVPFWYRFFQPQPFAIRIPPRSVCCFTDAVRTACWFLGSQHGRCEDSY